MEWSPTWSGRPPLRLITGPSTLALTHSLAPLTDVPRRCIEDHPSGADAETRRTDSATPCAHCSSGSRWPSTIAVSHRLAFQETHTIPTRLQSWRRGYVRATCTLTGDR